MAKGRIDVMGAAMAVWLVRAGKYGESEQIAIDKFSDDLKAELPLKRVWALVLEE